MVAMDMNAPPAYVRTFDANKQMKNLRDKLLDKKSATDSAKVGVVKNTNLIKVEYNGNAAIFALDGIYMDLGVNKLDRTYRTVTMVQDLHIKTASRQIDGPAIISVMAGKEGIIIIYASADLKTPPLYYAMKTSIAFRGDLKDRFHSQEDGIERPALVGINQYGVYWISLVNEKECELFYVPHSRPLLVSTSFEGGSSTKDWSIEFSTDGKELRVLDGQKPLLTAWAYDRIGEENTRIASLVKGDGTPRIGSKLSFNIVEDRSDMAGDGILLPFGPEGLASLCGIGKWESSETVKYMANTQRSDTAYIPHMVISREGIGVVELPFVGDYALYYRLMGAPYDANAKNPRSPEYVFAANPTGTLFGAIEVPSKEASKHNMAAFFLPGAFMMKVQMDGKGSDVKLLMATDGGVQARSSDGNLLNAIDISPLQVRVVKGQNSGQGQGMSGKDVYEYGFKSNNLEIMGLGLKMQVQEIDAKHQ
ncbi:Uncharacterised protein [uncultured archaeon]|nr:Uncharacterised protein [uncultured archaeon]